MMRGAVTALRRRADRQVKIAAGGTGEAAIAARIAEVLLADEMACSSVGDISRVI